MKVVNVRWAGAKRQVFNWVRLQSPGTVVPGRDCGRCACGRSREIREIEISGDGGPRARLWEICMREIARDVRDCNLRGRWSPGEIVGDVHRVSRRRRGGVTYKTTPVPSRTASAPLHFCATRAHLAHGRATARAAGASGFLPREGGQAHRQEATQEGAPPGEGGTFCFVFRCCAATASVVQLREVEPVEVAFASNSWAHRGKEARALHIRLLPAQRP